MASTFERICHFSRNKTHAPHLSTYSCDTTILHNPIRVYSSCMNRPKPSGKRVRVVLMTQVIGPLDYRLPDWMDADVGSVVVVPLGPRKMLGVIWDEGVFGDEAVDEARLRNVIEVADVPPIQPGLRRLVDWVTDYYLSSHAAVLRMVLSASAALSSGGTITEYRPSGVEPARLTPQRAAALDALVDAQGLVRELAEQAGVSEAVIRGLVKVGALEPVSVSIDAPFAAPDPDHEHPPLSDLQEAAAAVMRDAVRGGRFEPIVLDGVTGSGKTETYFEAVAEALRMGKQVLVLLPEIALTQPFLQRFEARFGVEPATWHSGMKQSQRRRTWRGVAEGRVQVVAGARSALFLPFANPGLIMSSMRRMKSASNRKMACAIMRAMSR
jgi:primosomal protein N' (replication factor Y)